MSSERKGNFEITWPLYEESPRRQFASHPSEALSSHTPQSGALRELSTWADTPESTGEEREAAERLRDSLPPPASDWMRAAQSLVTQLNRLLTQPSITSEQEGQIARTWAAWALGGASEAHVLRTAHLVMRAHSALREAGQSDSPHNQQMAAARVLHTGLPRAIKHSMPFERVLLVTRQIHLETDAWAAVVGGTCELLGWTDYARIHAAAVIRTAIEKDYSKRHEG